MSLFQSPLLQSRVRAHLRARLPPGAIRLAKKIRSLSKKGKRLFQAPIGLRRLEDDLREAGLIRGDIVMVHASLSGIGSVQGGAKTVIQSLMNVLTPDGTLLMPCFESADVVLKAAAEGEAIDLRTRCCETGAISEAFRTMSGVIRSSHPFASVCAWGKHAEFITSDHENDTVIWHKDSPLARLLTLKGKSLGLGGVSVANMTFLHVVEDIEEGFPVRPYAAAVPIVYSDSKGREVKRSVRRHDPSVSATRIDRPIGAWAQKHFAAVLERGGAMKRFRFGDGTAWTIDAAASLEVLKSEARRGITIYSTQAAAPARGDVRIPPRLRESLSDWWNLLRRPWLPGHAKSLRASDMRDLWSKDPGPEAAAHAAYDWLCLAQDRSTSADGGVARHYSLISGWADSYPETTGYIAPSILAYSAHFKNPRGRERARRMLDWLVSIQHEAGSFQGGTIRASRPVPVAFNTGQILLGLAAGARAFPGRYEEPLLRGARWMVRTQDADGAWSRFVSPYASPGPKAYDTHAAWGLLEASGVLAEKALEKAALANVRWAMGRQHANGWFDDCCLTDSSRPLTHTLGYALRGLVEAYRASKDPVFLEAAAKNGLALTQALRPDGSLPGRLDRDWRPAASWTCLTGNLQAALCWFSLSEWTSEPRFREAARAVNAHSRRTLVLTGPEELKGGIRGSFPVDGGYNPYSILSWGNKFFLDSQLAEISHG